MASTPNPYEPPEVEQPVSPLPSRLLGAVEIVLGLAFMATAIAMEDGSSMSQLMVTYSVLIGGGLLCLPGAVLFARSPSRWGCQVGPLLVIMWLVFAVGFHVMTRVAV